MAPRVSIFGFLGIVLFVALGLAAVRTGSPYLLTVMTWVVMYWLSASVLGAVFGAGAARTYWVGFAVFGWVYMLLVHLSLITTTLSYQMGAGLTDLIGMAWVQSPSVLKSLGDARWKEFPEFSRPEFAEFKIRVRTMIDLLLNLAFAYSGGMTALWFASRKSLARQAPHTTDTGGKR